MADIYSPPSYTYHNQRMRRTAPQSSSRIPLSSGSTNVTRLSSAPQPSRLEKMQANFQNQIMKEKEAKLIDMYERQQQQALNRVTSKQQPQKGIVRDFFRERRLMEQCNVPSGIPTRDKHFLMMKSEVQQQREVEKKEELSKMYSREDLTRKPAPGLDRSKPLAPLKHKSSLSNMAIPTDNMRHYSNEYVANATNIHVPPPGKKQLVKVCSLSKLPKRYSHNMEQYSDEEHSAEHPNEEILSPGPSRSKVNRFNQYERLEENHFHKQVVDDYKMINSEIEDVNQPSNFTRKMSHKKKVTPSRKKEEKLSDFQKWQMDQDLEREQRLEKLRKHKMQEQEEDSPTIQKARGHHQRGSKKSFQDDDRRKQYNDMKRKERELEQMIAQEEAELKRIKESYQSDDYDSPRNNQLYDSMNLLNLESQKPIKKIEDILPTPPKSKKPDKTRRYSFQSSAVTKKDTKHEIPVEDTTSTVTNYYADAQGEDVQEILNLKCCANCGRKFAADRIAKHVTVCRKSSRKRKTFDISKQRTDGTDLAKYVKHGAHLKSKPLPKSNWKRKHLDFMRTVRDARVVQSHIAKGGKLSDLPPPMPSDNSDYRSCPYCKRKFNPYTAERHIPKCKDIKSRPKPPSKTR